MARQFRKCVALSPIGDTTPGKESPDGDFRYEGRGHPSVAQLYAESKTSWIKLWADWYDIQPKGPDRIDVARILALDDNIRRARAALVKKKDGGTKQFGGIVLSTRGYPLWTNGTAGLVKYPDQADSPWKDTNTRNDPCVQALGVDRPRLTDPNLEFPVAHLRYRFPLRRPQGGASNACLGGSQVSYDFDVSVDSDWSYWIQFLATRYNPTQDPRRRVLPSDNPYAQLGLPDSQGAMIDYLEFVNEPNGVEGWPQLDATGAMIAPTVVARMFVTARYIRNVKLGGADGVLMVGPATADTMGDSGQATRKSIPCDLFTDALLRRLPGEGYVPTRNVAWSHHNYNDVTWKITKAPNPGMPGTPVTPSTNSAKPRGRTNRAALVREYLRYHRWEGWPNRDKANPYLLLTEGGVRRDKLENAQQPYRGQALETEHAARLKHMYELMRDSSGLGAGIAMFTQWQFYDEFKTKLDTGLASSPQEGGTRRQPVFDRWTSLTRYKKP